MWPNYIKRNMFAKDWVLISATENSILLSVLPRLNKIFNQSINQMKSNCVSYLLNVIWVGEGWMNNCRVGEINYTCGGRGYTRCLQYVNIVIMCVYVCGMEFYELCVWPGEGRVNRSSGPPDLTNFNGTALILITTCLYNTLNIYIT